MPKRAIWLLACVSLLAVGLYLVFSGIYYHVGFPLDDAWIHQTYARNLALRGEFSFLPGEPSGGSTAPLWTGLLALGVWLRLAPYFWTYLLGSVALWGLAVLGESVIRSLFFSYRPRIPWVGLGLALEWHLVWAAASGMETLLFALIATASLAMIVSGSQKYLGLGLLIGLSVWVRPDGITLLGPAAMAIFLSHPSWTKRLRSVIYLGLGFGSLFAFYILFNLILSGAPFPNTFYAKQAEYAALLQLPFLVRFGNEAIPIFEGVGLLLLPGLFLSLVSAFRRRSWGVIAAGAWLVGFIALYALRLPVTYQYGRYIMPAMPIYFLLGMSGLVEFSLVRSPHLKWMAFVFWRLTTGCVLVAFLGLGAIHYARDVAFIESEMVATAKWVSAELPPNALVAAHDIGALGYFGGHNLVDLAGLVSPEIIPYLRDEDRITTYMNERGVGYLVTFPDWYRSLPSGLIKIFSTNALFAPAMGEENMVVYIWPAP